MDKTALQQPHCWSSDKHNYFRTLYTNQGYPTGVPIVTSLICPVDRTPSNDYQIPPLNNRSYNWKLWTPSGPLYWWYCYFHETVSAIHHLNNCLRLLEVSLVIRWLTQNLMLHIFRKTKRDNPPLVNTFHNSPHGFTYLGITPTNYAPILKSISESL